MRMDSDTFDKALEKLWIHGGAVLDFAENASRGQSDWRDSYLAQGEQKRAQIDLVIRFAASSHCRMATLVRHFGDVADGKTNCGICDFCAPTECAAQQFRTATEAERETVLEVIKTMRTVGVKSTGKLHGDLFPKGEMVRDDFEELLGAMARAGLVRLAEAVFEKDGKSIPYRKVSLTRDAQFADEASLSDFVVKDLGAATSKPKKGKKAKRKRESTAVRGTRGARKRGVAMRPVEADAPAPVLRQAGPEPNPQIAEALKRWRLAEAKRLGVPAFRVLTDRAIQAMATNRPVTAAELLAIPGIGIATVEKYGRQFYRILNGTAEQRG